MEAREATWSQAFDHLRACLASARPCASTHLEAVQSFVAVHALQVDGLDGFADEV